MSLRPINVVVVSIRWYAVPSPCLRQGMTVFREGKRERGRSDQASNRSVTLKFVSDKKKPLRDSKRKYFSSEFFAPAEEEEGRRIKKA